MTLLHGLRGSVGGKTYGHFDIWFLKFQQIEFCLTYSSVSKWGRILNLHRKCIFIYHYDFIFALISRYFIGLLDILQEEGYNAKEKTCRK